LREFDFQLIQLSYIVNHILSFSVMKKAILLSFVLFSVLSLADAQTLSSENSESTANPSTKSQWYFKSCGVTDINNCSLDEFECLWERAEKNVRTGKIITGIGVLGLGASALLVTGLVAGELNDSPVTIIFTLTSFVTGIAGVLIGPPTWITGASRKNLLREHPHFEAPNLKSLNIFPSLNRNNFNNSYSLGLTATLSF
jgi:hypothetical protein